MKQTIFITAVTIVAASALALLLATLETSSVRSAIATLAASTTPGTIDAAVSGIWRTNFVNIFVQMLIIIAAVAALIQWVVYKPIMRLVASMQSTRLGKDSEASPLRENLFFMPLIGEISRVMQSLTQARTAASIEARMRLEKLDTPWTAERLKEFVKAHLKDRQIFVISNREPYEHRKDGSETRVTVPASGMVTALEPIMQATGGMWIAHGSGNADRESSDKAGKLRVPPDEPHYTLKRVWLSEDDVRGYYAGFSNEALWPLCHTAHTRPIFRKEDWRAYKKVNGTFAQSLLAEIKNAQRPLILVQDYQLALLPAMIKEARPDAQVALFWHIPWPSAEVFSICPYRKELLEGLLGADLVGFHTQQYCNNFMETVAKEIESVVDLERFAVTKEGHATRVKPLPISIGFTGADEKKIEQKSDPLSALGIKAEFVGLGVDRLDYTKGILERFKGVDFFLDAHPRYRERFTFLQIAPPSRESVEKYREYNEAVTAEAARINEKHGTDAWRPIVLEKHHYSHAALLPLYRRADVCLVTSLHDGMNLVAKEFVASRADERGALILSQFTGASRDLREALLVNPYSAEEVAGAIHTALTMTASEQHRRMKVMRDAVKNYNVYRWSSELIRTLANFT